MGIVCWMPTGTATAAGPALRTIIETMKRLTTARPPSMISRECAPAMAAIDAVDTPAAAAAPAAPPTPATAAGRVSV